MGCGTGGLTQVTAGRVSEKVRRDTGACHASCMRSGPPNSPRLRVHLIGRVAAELDGLTVSLKGRAARALALLALHRHVTKAQLATMLYQPENAEDENRQLTRALSELRNILGRDLLPLGTIYLATEPATDLDDLKTANTADELAALLRHGSTILPGLTDDWAEDVRREARRDFESLGRRLLSKLAPDSADRQRVAAQLRIVVPTFLATSEGMSSSAHAAALPHEIIIGVHRALDAVEPRDELTEEQTQELKTDLLHALGLMQRASKADQRYERSTLDLAQHAVDRLTAVAVPTDDLRLALARLYEGYDDFALARGQLAPLLARGDADSELLQCAGMIEMASGELAAADALFGRALERADDPQQALELRILLTVWPATAGSHHSWWRTPSPSQSCRASPKRPKNCALACNGSVPSGTWPPGKPSRGDACLRTLTAARRTQPIRTASAASPRLPFRPGSCERRPIIATPFAKSFTSRRPMGSLATPTT